MKRIHDVSTSSFPPPRILHLHGTKSIVETKSIVKCDKSCDTRLLKFGFKVKTLTHEVVSTSCVTNLKFIYLHNTHTSECTEGERERARERERERETHTQTHKDTQTHRHKDTHWQTHRHTENKYTKTHTHSTTRPSTAPAAAPLRPCLHAIFSKSALYSVTRLAGSDSFAAPPFLEWWEGRIGSESCPKQA
jgi:ABC-type nickel/cobalt efflux system permease component RcnA